MTAKYRIRRPGCTRKFLLIAAGWMLTTMPSAFGKNAMQDVGISQATKQSTGLPTFEVASVRENKSDEKNYSNFPLNSGPQYGPVGGLFVARNMLLLQYLVF